MKSSIKSRLTKIPATTIWWRHIDDLVIGGGNGLLMALAYASQGQKAEGISQ